MILVNKSVTTVRISILNEIYLVILVNKIVTTARRLILSEVYLVILINKKLRIDMNLFCL